ncbi:DMSO/selenate family reductase complex B subunit [Thermodesulfobacteriota bacterium]
MGEQLGFHIDAQYCSGCKTCQIACKDKNDLEVGQLWRKVTLHEHGEWMKQGAIWQQNVSAYWITMSCNHCENPACVEVCPTGAMHKRKTDGIVVVDQECCAGCQSCSQACPYDAPVYHSQTNTVRKCDFCRDRLAEGNRPACVDACPYQLIHFGSLAELEAEKGGTAWVKGLVEPTLTRPALRLTPNKAAAWNR